MLSELKITHHAADLPRSTRRAVCHARLACLGSKLPHMSTPDPRSRDIQRYRALSLQLSFAHKPLTVHLDEIFSPLLPFPCPWGFRSSCLSTQSSPAPSASEVRLHLLAPHRQSPQADISPVPVVQGGMQWVGYAELASAVSNAGGLGIVSDHCLPVRSLTNPPSSSQPSPNPPPRTCAKKSAAAAP